ncbi:hypothetical protein GCM10027052_02510 [Parafrigoribacterium mesophilum]
MWLGTVSILISAASVFWSREPEESFFYVVSSLEAMLVFVAFIALLREASAQQIAKFACLWIIALLIGSALLWSHVPGFLPPASLNPASGDYISYFSRLSHPLIGRSNNLAALLSLFVIPLAAWSWRTKNRFAGVTATATAGATLLTFSRGTLLALALGVVLYLIIDGKNGRRLVKLGWLPLVVIVGVSSLVLLLNPTMASFISSRFSGAGYEARTDLLSQSLGAILNDWAVGTGGGTGSDVHNTFVQQIVYFGLFLGLVVCILLVRVTTWWFRKEHGESRWLARSIGIGFVVQMASFLVESSYEGSLLRPLIWMSWGLLVALFSAYQRESQFPLSEHPDRLELPSTNERRWFRKWTEGPRSGTWAHKSM